MTDQEPGSGQEISDTTKAWTVLIMDRMKRNWAGNGSPEVNHKEMDSLMDRVRAMEEEELKSLARRFQPGDEQAIFGKVPLDGE